MSVVNRLFQNPNPSSKVPETEKESNEWVVKCGGQGSASLGHLPGLGSSGEDSRGVGDPSQAAGSGSGLQVPGLGLPPSGCPFSGLLAVIICGV